MSFTRLWPTRLRTRKFGLLISSSEYLTSSAVKAVPSCHLTLLRSLIFQVRPSADRPPFSTLGISRARSGTKLPSASMYQSVEKSCHQTAWSTSMPGISGLKTVGSCESAAMIWPRGLSGGAAARPTWAKADAGTAMPAAAPAPKTISVRRLGARSPSVCPNAPCFVSSTIVQPPWSGAWHSSTVRRKRSGVGQSPPHGHQ